LATFTPEAEAEQMLPNPLAGETARSATFTIKLSASGELVTEQHGGRNVVRPEIDNPTVLLCAMANMKSLLRCVHNMQFVANVFFDMDERVTLAIQQSADGGCFEAKLVLAAAFQSFPESLSRHVRLTKSLQGFTHSLSVEQRVKIDATRSKHMLHTLGKAMAQQGATIAAMAKQAERMSTSLRSLDGGGGGGGGSKNRKKKNKRQWTDDDAYEESNAQAQATSPDKGGKGGKGGRGSGGGKGGKGDRGGKGERGGKGKVTFATQRISPATLAALKAAYPGDDEPILNDKRWEWLQTFPTPEASKAACYFKDKLKLVCKSESCPACN